MGILIKMAESRAIKKIAKKMPPFLISSYGYSEGYTPAQVARALEETGCNSDYLDHAYAMFCNSEVFNEFCDGDFESLHQEIADLCFGGNNNFNFSDVSAFSGESGGGSDDGG